MNTGTKTMRMIVSWFAVVASDSASRGLRRLGRLVDIYRNLYVQDLKRAKSISLRAEKILQLTGDLVFAGFQGTDWNLDRRKIDIILVLCLGIVWRCRQV